MNRFFHFALAVALALSVGMGMGAAAPTPTETETNATATPTPVPNATNSENATISPTPTEAPATENTTSSSTPTETETRSGPTLPSEIPDPRGTETETETVENASGTPIDEHVTLLDWRYSEGTFTLVFENTHPRPSTVTLTESTQPEEGAQQFSVREERLLKGTTTITMTTKIQGGESAVSITTAASIDAGRGTVISTGAQGANPFRPFGGTSGVLSGVGLAIIMSGAAAAWVLWREETGVMEA